MLKLKEISIRGFKSIHDAVVRPGTVNILIGANGAGKSNLISFFRFISYLIASPTGSLQRYVAEHGGASSLLFGGAKRTRELEASILVETEKGLNEYRFRLFFASGDTLVFAEEKCRFVPHGKVPGNWTDLGVGQKEANLLDRSTPVAKATKSTITSLLRGLVVYHFQDTSREARIKTRWPISDSAHLKYDAANLAPFLWRMSIDQPVYYRRIVETIRQVAPFFDTFSFDDGHDSMLLQWSERNTDMTFSADQASDGTLRAMALITALLQPPQKLPPFIVLDEPELGLHPYAMTIVAGLIRAAAVERQVLLATQSPSLLEQFEPGDILVVDRDKFGSHFTRLDEERLREWLDDYSLAELWNLNILGGRPKEVAS